jgi:oligoendopeptidase F
LESGLEPEGYEIPLRGLRADAAIFREENLPLQTQESTLGTEYDKIMGAQSIEWQSEELTLPSLVPLMQKSERPIRKQLWQLEMDRWLKDREAVNTLWTQFMDLRGQIGKNAGFDNYREYMWQAMHRHDYTPGDCFTFHDAIEKVVVPAATRIHEKKRKELGVDSLRPWDWDVKLNVTSAPALTPYGKIEELDETTARIFRKVDPELGEYYATMQREGLLDLPNRKGKAPGAYCTDYPVLRRPFVYCNSVGTHDSVQTLLHEAGHAFHVFESYKNLPHLHQLTPPMEFAEVASMAMELLAAPYLSEDQGGFYSPEDTARARIEHLEGNVTFWPYMAVVDAFQHWVYENHAVASAPANCDAKWSELWDRFMPGVDWSGLQTEKETGWHRKLHIHHVPFYYIEYGLAQLGATQVWANALEDQAGAVSSYRKALALGGTATLPDLYAAAGAKLSFDVDTLGTMINLIEKTVDELEQVL